MTLTVRVTAPDRGVDVALEVRRGQTVALLGPNGAGKSTVLGATVGVVRPAQVSFAGTDLSTLPPHRRRIALLDQQALLFPHLDALDNVAFAPRAAGVGRREARQRARSWLAEVGAEDLAARRPGRLSGGQAQRVALARALAAEPRVLLLDEPLAALDVGVAAAMRQLLHRVLAERTAIVVTHDVLDALLLADRVVVLEQGRVVEDGPTAQVLRRPRSAFSARIAGLNLVRGRLRGGALEVDDDRGRRVHGLLDDPGTGEDEELVAVFSPGAVSVFAAAPGGSPRNAFDVTVRELEPLGDRVRVRGDTGWTELAADVTAASVAELSLAPGRAVTFVVKANEVSLVRAGIRPAG